MTEWRPSGNSKHDQFIGRQLKRLLQATGGVPIRMRAAPLELLNSRDPEASPLGQRFLREPGGSPVLPK
jgi:hypothetical protein